MNLRLLSFEEFPLMLPLLQELNPNTDLATITARLQDMNYDCYKCLGAFIDGKLVGICGMWTLTRIHSGLQIEVDNVAVEPTLRSQKIGQQMMAWVHNYARELGCNTVELNAYVGNYRAHKFYMNEGYRILGFHMQKKLL